MRHGHGLCECCAPTAAAESLGEVSFARSACAAALSGDYFRVKSLATRTPAVLNEDGCGGKSSALRLPCLLEQTAGGAVTAGSLQSDGRGSRRCSPLVPPPAVNSAPAFGTGSSGYTPLIYAAREGHADVVALLLELGADPNASTTAGSSTALHRAAYMGHGAIVQLLLAGRANPTLQDADGQTALHKAIQQGHTEVAAALLIACPELAAVRDNRQRVAADMADRR